MFITNNGSVVSKTKGDEMPDCSHEEAVTRIVVHVLHALAVLHALSGGAKSIQVRTVDTDVLVILVCKSLIFNRYVLGLNCALHLVLGKITGS